MKYCSYYQARVDKKETLFFVAILRSFDHLCFDRTLDPHQELFEFFVPSAAEKEFLKIMTFFTDQHIVDHLEKLPNRLEHNNL
jgi:hypothetical protein